jgi:hypothetical protein
MRAAHTEAFHIGGNIMLDLKSFAHLELYTQTVSSEPKQWERSSNICMLAYQHDQEEMCYPGSPCVAQVRSKWEEQNEQQKRAEALLLVAPKALHPNKHQLKRIRLEHQGQPCSSSCAI